MTLKGDAYETTEEVRFRLENTIVLYEGKPVYITGVEIPAGEKREDGKKEIARVYIKKMPLDPNGRGEAVRKFLSSKNFDLAPFRMGYFNHKGSAIYATRVPVRQNKQGLSAATAKFLDIRGRPHQALNWDGFIISDALIQFTESRYPTFKEAGDLIGDEAQASVAVSSSFAFHIDQDLEALFMFHRGVKCGVVMKGEGKLKLPPKFHFLRQEAEECRIPLA